MPAQSAQCRVGRVGAVLPGDGTPAAALHTAIGAAASGIAADTAVGNNPSISSATIASQAATAFRRFEIGRFVTSFPLGARL